MSYNDLVYVLNNLDYECSEGCLPITEETCFTNEGKIEAEKGRLFVDILSNRGIDITELADNVESGKDIPKHKQEHFLKTLAQFCDICIALEDSQCVDLDDILTVALSVFSKQTESSTKRGEPMKKKKTSLLDKFGNFLERWDESYEQIQLREARKKRIERENKRYREIKRCLGE